jgi:predicted porin
LDKTMNRTLPSLAAAATLAALSTGTATAQSSVTLYGIIDAGVTQVNGLRGGSIKQLSSGIMDGTRLGVRVNEDMGGGWRALATLEQRIELDTGGFSNRPPSGSALPDRLSQAARLGLPAQLQPVVSSVAANIGAGIGVNLNNAAWDRQAFAGLVTPVGAILAGRQYTPAFEVSATFDTLGTQSSLSAGQVGSLPAGFDIRLSNSVAYRIQAGGFTASLMAAAREGSGTTGRFGGAMAMYKNQRFSVGVGYNARDNEVDQKSLTSLVLGASVNIGPGTLSLMGATIEDKNPTGLSGLSAQLTPTVGSATAAVVANAFTNALRQDSRLSHIGYKLVLGSNTVYVAYTELDDTRAPNADTRSFGVAYSYALSKRTDINAVATRFDNSGLGQAAPGGGGYLGGITASAGTDSTSLALGIRHRF